MVYSTNASISNGPVTVCFQRDLVVIVLLRKPQQCAMRISNKLIHYIIQWFDLLFYSSKLKKRHSHNYKEVVKLSTVAFQCNRLQKSDDIYFICRFSSRFFTRSWVFFRSFAVLRQFNCVYLAKNSGQVSSQTKTNT